MIPGTFSTCCRTKFGFSNAKQTQLCRFIRPFSLKKASSLQSIVRKNSGSASELDVISDDKALLERICQTVRKRCLVCIDEDGGHIEHTTCIN
ncbi:unnamed protein product [Macrosiphum euphorbiae]|uniref:Uncharacterized protein n=1 Tax=Macrosiphum euphorbiae TaxID=13131 RepID=A0AAV0VFL7_9HEMI|nr:unnamed protein product [Macrosiphum euphorbiae]